MSFHTKSLALVCLASTLCGILTAHPADENPELTLPETTKEFRNDRFGLFIHWGIYSTLADGEQVMTDRDISQAAYSQLPRFFNPADYDPASWVGLAKTAGARYLTINAKSRDGFAMWDSAASDWTVTKKTPYGKDVVRAAVEEAQRNSLKIFLYYSPLDRRMSEQAGPPGTATDDARSTVPIALMRAQFIELLTKYGAINGIRLGPWSQEADAPEQLQQTYKLIHDLQHNLLIGSDHGGSPRPNENFQIINGGLAALQPAVDDDMLEYSSVPMEVNDTVNDSRGYNIFDDNYKSARELVHQLVRAAGADSNYVLHVGAMPNGQVPQEVRNRLHQVGMWLAKNGESVYETRGGPMAPQEWGVTMHRGRKIYVHVLDPTVDTVEVKLPMPFRTARYFPDETNAEYELITSDTVRLKLRPEQRDELERIVQVQTQNYR